MKYLAVLLSIVCLSYLSQSAEKPVKNKSVAFQIRLKEKAIKPGGMNSLLVSLKPNEGIHINLTPPISIKFDSSDAFKIDSALVLPKNPKNAYLDASKNIEQLFTVSKSAKPGGHEIKGVLTYYFCSDAEGWCSKFKQPFEVTLKVSQ